MVTYNKGSGLRGELHSLRYEKTGKPSKHIDDLSRLWKENFSKYMYISIIYREIQCFSGRSEAQEVRLEGVIAVMSRGGGCIRFEKIGNMISTIKTLIIGTWASLRYEKISRLSEYFDDLSK